MICCGRGEAIELLKHKIGRPVSVDISTAILQLLDGKTAAVLSPATIVFADVWVLSHAMVFNRLFALFRIRAITKPAVFNTVGEVAVGSIG